MMTLCHTMHIQQATTFIHVMPTFLNTMNTITSIDYFLESLHFSLAKNSANERVEFPRAYMYVPLLKSLRDQ